MHFPCDNRRLFVKNSNFAIPSDNQPCTMQQLLQSELDLLAAELAQQHSLPLIQVAVLSLVLDSKIHSHLPGASASSIAVLRHANRHTVELALQGVGASRADLDRVRDAVLRVGTTFQHLRRASDPCMPSAPGDGANADAAALQTKTLLKSLSAGGVRPHRLVKLPTESRDPEDTAEGGGSTLSVAS